MAAQKVRQPIRWPPASWTLCLLTAVLVVTAYVNHHVPESYMDEPFHVPMVQQYCRGDFLSWDPKITTFPGLYYLGVAYARLSHVLLSWTGASLEDTCSGPFLRSLNAVLAVVCIQLAYALSTELQQQALQQDSGRSSSGTGSKSSNKSSQKQQQQEVDIQQRAAGVALVVGLLPTQLFFAFLFYTDVASLLFLLLTELLLVRGATYAAAAAGAAAIGMRQTNAVWVTFLTGAAMLQYLLQQRQHQQQQSPAKGSGGSNGSSSVGSTQQQAASEQQRHPAAELLSLLGCARQHKGALIIRFWLLLLLPATFCVFVVWNGSITLGDKEAHAPSAHLMQPLYFGLFLLSNAALLLLQPSITGPLLAGIKGRPLVWILGLLAAAAGGVYIAARYSLAHPYLLADNRHYTFYIWRKVVNRHAAVRYCLVPLYIAGWVLLLTGLSATQHWMWVAAFVASTCVTLVPAWLIEFRYFTAPFAMAVLHLPAPPRLASFFTAAAYCVVNAATLYVFAMRPYTWSDGSVARFMW